MIRKVIQILLAVVLTACTGSHTLESDHSVMKKENNIILVIQGHEVEAVLEENPATEKLLSRLENGPVTVSAHDYAGFEKVGSLKEEYPTNDRRITTDPGDLMLYTGNQLVLFTGSNTWEYTPIGHLTDLSVLDEIRDEPQVEITLKEAAK